MRILFLTQFFYPDIQATSRIFLQLCEDLSKTHKVRVVCGMPLVQVDDQDCKGNICRQNHNGVEIIRLKSARRIKKSLLDRAINHCSFVFSAFFYLIHNRGKSDILIFTSDNPFNFLCSLLFIKKPKIYICQDLYKEQSVTAGLIKNGIFLKILGLCQRIAYWISDRIVVIGKMMADYISFYKRISLDKIEVIPNWADTDQIIPSDKLNTFSKEHSLSDKFVVLHSGRVGLMQDLQLLVKCAKELTHYKDIVFVIIGEGAVKAELIDLAEKEGLCNILFLGYQPEKILRYSLATASVGVILYKKDLSHCLVPSRLYGIMASARPVIASVVENSEVSEIINDSSCGVVVEPSNLEGLKSAVLSIYTEREQIEIMGNKGREYVVKHFSRKLMTDRYAKIIKKVTKLKKTKIRNHEKE